MKHGGVAVLGAGPPWNTITLGRPVACRASLIDCQTRYAMRTRPLKQQNRLKSRNATLTASTASAPLFQKKKVFNPEGVTCAQEHPPGEQQYSTARQERSGANLCELLGELDHGLVVDDIQLSVYKLSHLSQKEGSVIDVARARHHNRAVMPRLAPAPAPP